MAATVHTLDTADAWERAKAAHAAEQQARTAASAGPEPLVEYQTDPIGFCVDVLGVPRHTLVWSDNAGYEDHDWDGTADPLAAVLQGLADGRNVAVESCTGSGKSYLAACLALWFWASFKNARVGTYAPVEKQLRKYMWAEMGKLWPRVQARFPSALIQDLAIYMDGSDPSRELWSIVGTGVRIKSGETSATAAQGFHAEHMLLILEETPGIDPAVVEALEHTCTAPHNLRLALGNPDSKTDTLHLLWARPSWRGITISGLDHPNVVADNPAIVPGAVSRASIIARAEDKRVPLVNDEYDLRSDDAHQSFKSRVRGIPPDQSRDALIRLEWIEAAQQRLRDAAKAAGSYRALVEARTADKWPGALGVDPSQSEDGDQAGLARFLGPYCVSVLAEPCPNAMHFGRQVFLLASSLGIHAAHIGVDAIGIGASTVNALNDLVPAGQMIPALHSGGAPEARIAKPGEGTGWLYDAGLFANLRAQMYWQLAQDLQHDRIALPEDLELVEELTQVKYDDAKGKVLIEGKDKLRERLGRSPNKADAVVYANWVRSRVLPIEATIVNPDDRHLGWKRSGKGLKPKDPIDLEQGRQRPAARGTTVQPWWKR